MFFVDPNGRKLTVSGDSILTAGVLQFISGLSQEQFSNSYSVDENGLVTLDVTELDRNQNEGLRLLDDYISSKKSYLLEFRPVTKDETNRLGVINKSESPRNPWSKSGELSSGSGGQIVIGTNVQWLDAATQLKITLENITFHELAENFSRTELGRIYGVGPKAAALYEIKPYEGAHFDAIKLQTKWIHQGQTFFPIPTGPVKAIIAPLKGIWYYGLDPTRYGIRPR